jgi:hypothetical protein
MIFIRNNERLSARMYLGTFAPIYFCIPLATLRSIGLIPPYRALVAKKNVSRRKKCKKKRGGALKL